ncbi:hypothetical protein K0B04_00495 [Patescibacteria group bacterium]|nr:hypothetical protein [Patescibacteria group bacterium]
MKDKIKTIEGAINISHFLFMECEINPIVQRVGSRIKAKGIANSGDREKYLWFSTKFVITLQRKNNSIAKRTYSIDFFTTEYLFKPTLSIV